MRRWIVAALLLLCLPVVGRGQSIRYYPDSTSYTLGKTESGILYRAASANPTLLDGLVSYWPLDEISGVRYDAVGSNDLTDNNTVGAVLRGPEGTVAHFTKANSESLAFMGGWTNGAKTVNVWCRLDAIGADDWATIFDDRNGGGVLQFYSQGGVPVYVRAYSYDGAGYPEAGSGWGETYIPQAANRWVMLTGVWTANQTRLYVNGVQRFSVATAALPILDNDYSGAFGAISLYQGTGGLQFFHGGLAHASIWSGDIGSTKIASLFGGGNAVPYADLADKTDLISYYAMDEVSGTRYDSHGTNHLTDNNTVGSVINAGDAMDGAAASFVAANSEKLNRTGVNFGFTDFSISLWAKTPVSAAAYQEYVCKNNTIDFDLRSYDANYVQFNVNGSSAQIQTDTNWHLIVAYYVHSEKKAYLTIDAGVPTAGAAGTGLSETTSELAIGAATSIYNNNGLIDEVAIWDRVLTSDRITELWNAGAGVYYPTFQ